MKTIKSTLYVVPIGLLTLLSTSCGNDTSSASFTVGGMLSGLKGSGLVLQNNGGDDLALSADGTFTFSASVSSGSQYAVTVKSQPQNPTQTCTVAAGSGNVGTANVTGVQVNCSTNTYSVGGSVSGLVGGGLVLQNNAGDDLTIGNNGTFTFLTKIASGSTYDVQVKTQPGTPPQTCTVTSGTGTIATSDVTTVSVVCAPTLYKVGGTVTGLGANPVVLQNNLGDDLSVAANGAFQFAMGLQNGAAYAVSVKTRPAGQNCTVASGTGTIASANVTNVAVTCVNAPYYVLTGTPTHTTVFNTIAETYKFPNNLTNQCGLLEFQASHEQLCGQPEQRHHQHVHPARADSRDQYGRLQQGHCGQRRWSGHGSQRHGGDHQHNDRSAQWESLCCVWGWVLWELQFALLICNRVSVFERGQHHQTLQHHRR
jgi:hypothetical protein